MLRTFFWQIEYFLISTTVCAENVNEINHFHTSCVINKLIFNTVVLINNINIQEIINLL